MSKKNKRVVIVGSGVAGRDVAREIRLSPDLNLFVLGFIDDDLSKQNKRIDKILIIGQGKDLPKVIREKKVDEVIIAIPSAEGSAITKYVKMCSEARVAVRIVPRVKEIIEGKAHVKTLREVRVEDLLGRPVVKSDVAALHAFFNNKTVFVTGAAGSIGSELSRQIAAYKPSNLILFDWWENGLFDLQQELMMLYPDLQMSFIVGNIRDKQRLTYVFNKFKPNLVFHAAAYKHVPLMELHPSEAVKNNVFGTLQLATIAKKTKVDRFVLISTDKAAHPVSVMGATKLITEGIGKSLNSSRTKFMSVRFGNVLDSFGSVIPTFKKQIDKGGPVTITDKRMTRYFMTIPEATQLILKAAQMGEGGELFVLDMGEPVKIVDLAQNLIRLSGYIPNKDIKLTFTGKRPGEKIHERLFNQKETLQKTIDKKIFVTESLGFNIEKLDRTLQQLKKHTQTENSEAVRKELSLLIPSFKPD